LGEAFFPTPIEQRAFVKAYVEHRSDYFHPGPTSGSRTPGSISTFTLDTPVSPSQTVEGEGEQTEKEIERLMRDARLWRAANSAQWVAWGVVQAHVPDMNNDLPIALDIVHRNKPGRQEASPISMTSHSTEAGGAVPAKVSEVEDSAEDGNEFDYLAYAQERAMFFWGDLLSLGVISAHELPPQLLPKLKIVNY
jgi:choline kinase